LHYEKSILLLVLFYLIPGINLGIPLHLEGRKKREEQLEKKNSRPEKKSRELLNASLTLGSELLYLTKEALAQHKLP
jgi:hypothetical protein